MSPAKLVCPHCDNDDLTLITVVRAGVSWFCEVCGKKFEGRCG
jgi:ribosomal protein L37AE/L43A